MNIKILTILLFVLFFTTCAALSYLDSDGERVYEAKQVIVYGYKHIFDELAWGDNYSCKEDTKTSDKLIKQIPDYDVENVCVLKYKVTKDAETDMIYPKYWIYVIRSHYLTYMVCSKNNLWAWGINWYGMVGDGTTIDRNKPVWIMDNVNKVAAGYVHSVALCKEGYLWAWGSNYVGKLGDGYETKLDDWNQIVVDNNRHFPIMVLSNVVTASTLSLHTLAIREDGTLWAWGLNNFGQLGDGTTTNRLTPTWIMDDVKAVAAGGRHSLAIRNDGSLWAWGWNSYGQLGDGTQNIYSEDFQRRLVKNDRHTPVKVMEGVVSVAAGLNHSFAIKEDGSLWVWGRGPLGLGASKSRGIINPTWVMDEVKSVNGTTAGVLRYDGSLWGLRTVRGVGIDNDYLQQSRYFHSPILNEVAFVPPNGFTIVIKTDGTAWVWGFKSMSINGDGVTIESAVPIQIDNRLFVRNP